MASSAVVRAEVPATPRAAAARLRSVPEGIRITKVGLWYVLFSVIVAIAATNTGNNALYMVLAVMLAALVTSGLISRQNVRGLEVVLEPAAEIYANRPFRLGVRVSNRSRLLPRWFLLATVSRSGQPLLVPYLPRRGTSEGELDLILERRGVVHLRGVHVTSLFPFGFFRKGVRYGMDLGLLVFPEIFPAAASELEARGQQGEEAARRPGWGHDLHALRSFRQGDDPRGIHWKQTARTGDVVYMEREAETSRRLAILFDNGVGELQDAEQEQRFERLVSEAATAAVDHLERGYEVELVTRDRTVAFGLGLRQRLAILEALALVAPLPRTREPLHGSDARAPQLRLALEDRRERRPGRGGVPA